MTEQELFDTVWHGLASQDFRQSLDTDTPGIRPPGACSYRSPDGLKCAAGWVLPDEAYDPEMEGNAVDELREFTELFQRRTLNFLRVLQLVHDDSKTPVEMQRRLRDVADRYGLQVPS